MIFSFFYAFFSFLVVLFCHSCLAAALNFFPFSSGVGQNLIRDERQEADATSTSLASSTTSRSSTVVAASTSRSSK